MATWHGYDHSGQARWESADYPVASGRHAQIFQTTDQKWAIKAFTDSDKVKQAGEEVALYREIAGQARLKQVMVELAGWGEGFLVFGWYGAGSLEAWMRVGGELRPSPDIRQRRISVEVLAHLLEEMADGLRRSAPVADVPVEKAVVPKPVKAPELRAEPPEVKAPELIPMHAPNVQVPKSVAWLPLGFLALLGGAVVMAGSLYRMRASEEMQAGADWTSPTLGKMKWIPAGTFVMGSPAGETGRRDDETQHEVTLTRGFWLMEHAVTQGEWQAVMGSNPSYFKKCGSTCPVENVSWDDIQTYIQKVSTRDGVKYQLPTEAQWEYAARGGQEYIYAGSNDLNAVGWYGINSGNTTHPGCKKQRNGYGLCDMSGNVWEWVQDWYGDYLGSTSDYVNKSSDPGRVLRGGSWLNDPSFARVAFRYRLAPGARGNGALGFRLARLQ